MSWNNALTQILWVGGPLMEAAVLVQAQRRRLWDVCPMFWIYVASHIARFFVLYPLRAHMRAYFVAYWIAEVTDVFLIIAILYSLYSRLFGAYQALRAWQDWLFRWATAICVLMAVVVAASVPGRDFTQLMAGLVAFDLGAAVLKMGLITFALAISSALALRWNRYSFAILVGLGVYNSVVLAATAAYLHLGTFAARPYQLIKPAAYVCAILVWFVYLYGKESEQVPLTLVPENDLASWNEALLHLLNR
jgi:hypothetical protein